MPRVWRLAAEERSEENVREPDQSEASEEADERHEALEDPRHIGDTGHVSRLEHQIQADNHTHDADDAREARQGEPNVLKPLQVLRIFPHILENFEQGITLHLGFRGAQNLTGL